MPSLTSRPGVLRLVLVLLAVLLTLSLSGLLAPLQRALALAMAARPLPAAYFLVFILLGALLPLSLRLLNRRDARAIEVLDPYLLLLAGQIATELLVTAAGGKGLGVLVGMVFTLVRLLQLLQLLPLAAGRSWLRGLLTLQLVLWSVNALQMLVQRWWPLLA